MYMHVCGHVCVCVPTYIHIYMHTDMIRVLIISNCNSMCKTTKNSMFNV